jgi:formylglycine-generating enzyme required for sulfatase activity
LAAHKRTLGATLLLLGLLGLLGLLWLLGVFGNRPNPPVPSPADHGAASPPPVQEDLGQVIRRKTLRVFAPSITVEPLPLPRELWQGTGTLLTGLGLGLFLFLRLRTRRYLPPPAAAPTRPGPAEILPSVPAQPGRLRLLNVRSEEALVWGIGRFVSEERTRRLDVPASINATVAAAGIPTLRFLRARHQREVWLWMDESAAGTDREYGPLLRQLVLELGVSLRRGGLPVEQALYWGLPDRLSRLLESGHLEGEFAPSEVDERRDAALIVLLTDGRILVDALTQDRFIGETRALLRQLAHFPKLAFCDVSRGTFGLAQHLRKFELEVLLPEQVAKFLGGVPLDPLRPPQPVQTQLVGDLRLWAAACALSPYPLDEETLFLVRDQLSLAVEPAASLRLKALAQSIGDRIHVAGPLRVELLRWMRLVSDLPAGPLESLQKRLSPTALGRSLALWRRRLATEDATRQTEDARMPWLGTPARQHLRLQVALLDLWDRPEHAAQTLYSLSCGELRDELLRKVSAFGPLEQAADPRLIILPWSFRQLSPVTQALLHALEFGGRRPPKSLAAERPARLVFAWAGCVGLVLSGAVTSAQALSRFRHPHGEPRIRQEHAPKEAHVQISQQSETEYLLTAQHRTEQTSQQVPAGSEVLVTWTEEEREPPNADGAAEPPPDLGADLSDACDLFGSEDPANPAPPLDLAKPKTETARPRPPTQDMTVSSAGKSPTRSRPQSPAMPEIIAGGKVVSTLRRTETMLEDQPSCTRSETTLKGVVFVKVCGGDFMMGSNDGVIDEQPVHPVHVDTFWIGKYEVSNAQYREWKADHKDYFDEPAQPVNDVSWFSAKEYCQWLGGELPTEAEWEYAARGPEGRKYPWGSAAPEKGRATFEQGSGGQPDLITANPKGVGPFGTWNQAGNVWEWCADWHSDSYKVTKDKTGPDKPWTIVKQVNPIGPATGSRHVLRGGSFWTEPWSLRSTFRAWVGPENGSRLIGFRCVRGSGRQR